MGTPNLKDDRLAVLRRLENHGARSISGEEHRGEENAHGVSARPALSGRVVATVLIIFALIATAMWAPWRTRDETMEIPAPGEELPLATSEDAADSQSRNAEDGEGSEVPGPGATPASVVVVNVVGHVHAPGVHELPSGSRVIDAIEIAGGATEKGDLTRLNLARKLNDEEYLAVLGTDEEPPQILPPATGQIPESQSGAQSAPNAPGEANDAVLDLNTATHEQLMTLPGVGPVLAERIVHWRTQHEGFQSVDELREVSGVGPKIFEQLQPRVTV